MNKPSSIFLSCVIAISIGFCWPWAVIQQARADTEAPAVKVAAYFEAGSYWEFSLIYRQILAALEERGVLQHVVFPEGLHLSPGWDASEGEYRSVARRLMTNGTVDVILSMGTAATKALLAENNGKTPIMAIDIADPAGAGIVDSRTGIGAPNLTVQYIKDKWNKVFALFHEAFPFRRLGVMYYDSPEGLSYSNVREAREVARERGFALVEYPHLDKAESLDSCEQGVRTLIDQGIDAFYISALNCFDWTRDDPQSMLDALTEQGVKTFARDGSVHVRRGALMGLSTLNYAPLGKYYADRIAQQLGLLPPETILEKDVYTPKITLNLVTARGLAIDIPLLLLISADEIFDSTLTGVQNATMVQ